MLIKPLRHLLAIATICAAPLAATMPAHAQSIVFALPGVPPVFLSVQEYVAQDAGFFKKYGVDVTLRQFDTGTAAGRAVASGDVDITMTPTPVVVNMVGNGKVPLVGIYGLEHADWLIASTDPTVKTCKDLVGKSIGVDTPGGARSIALRQMTAPCGIKMEQMQQVPLGSNTSSSMIAGQIKVGVLHLDDVSVIEGQMKKPLIIVTRMKDSKPVSHYDLLIMRKDKLEKNRDKAVRIVAALIEAERYMRDPKNADRVADMAKPTGRNHNDAKDALKKYLDLEFWPKDGAGLTPANIEAEIKTQTAVGGIKKGNTPPTVEGLTDPSIYKDAIKLVDKK
jgi:NitT/TauT family transport system substrate-binding protein